MWDILVAMVTVLMTLFGIVTAGHALITKRDPKGAFGWITICIVFPFIGPFIYYVFGINRVQRRAKKLYYGFSLSAYEDLFEGSDSLIHPEASAPIPGYFIPQVRISDRIARRPVCSGNDVVLLHNGEEAYPAMLEAIEKARRSVFLTTYIFEVDRTGTRFIEALERAHNRGVMVRILIDGLGEMHWGAIASRHLRKKGLPVARFIPPTLFPPDPLPQSAQSPEDPGGRRRVGFYGGHEYRGSAPGRGRQYARQANHGYSLFYQRSPGTPD